MREIKFRAWDKERKIWLDHRYHKFTWHISPTEGLCMSHGWDSEDAPISFGPPEDKNRYALMQFTGLLDRKGKEIYDGDVLDNFLEENRISIRWDETHAGWQFDEHGIFLDDGVGRGNWDFNFGVSKNCEVIGNIYENPELLNPTPNKGEKG